MSPEEFSKLLPIFLTTQRSSISAGSFSSYAREVEAFAAHQIAVGAGSITIEAVRAYSARLHPAQCRQFEAGIGNFMRWYIANVGSAPGFEELARRKSRIQHPMARPLAVLMELARCDTKLLANAKRSEVCIPPLKEADQINEARHCAVVSALADLAIWGSPNREAQPGDLLIPEAPGSNRPMHPKAIEAAVVSSGFRLDHLCKGFFLNTVFVRREGALAVCTTTYAATQNEGGLR